MKIIIGKLKNQEMDLTKVRVTEDYDAFKSFVKTLICTQVFLSKNTD